VHLDGHARAVVPDAHPAGVGLHVHAQGVHGRVAHLVVRGVDQDLVEDFVQAGHVRDVAAHHAAAALPAAAAAAVAVAVAVVDPGPDDLAFR